VEVIIVETVAHENYSLKCAIKCEPEECGAVELSNSPEYALSSAIVE
jgi:hypothetical protein